MESVYRRSLSTLGTEGFTFHRVLLVTKITHRHLFQKLMLYSVGNLDSCGSSLSRRKTRSHSTARASEVQLSIRRYLSYWSIEKEVLPGPWTSGLCSLPQLGSYNGPYGTPGVFYSGNLEGEGELAEEAFTIVATHRRRSFREPWGQCVANWDREGSTSYAINVLWNRSKVSTFHVLPRRSYVPHPEKSEL